MTISRRASQRSPQEAAKRRREFLKHSSAKRRPTSRLRGVETLETRSLMAADAGIFVSNYWNYKAPTDVNDDGRSSMLDLLAIVNDLTSSGSRALPGREVGGQQQEGGAGESETTTSGEGETSTDKTYFVDVNNDARVNLLDLLSVLNDLTGEGEPGPPIVRFNVQPVFVGTATPLPTDAQGRYLIAEGDYYELRVMVQDTGVLTYMGETRDAVIDDDGPSGPAPPRSLLGALTAFMDMAWDTSRTDVIVTETQTIDIGGTPTGIELGAGPLDHTTFRLTFNSLQTGVIDYSLVPAFTARNIRDALVTALGVNGTTDIGGVSVRNVEVEPVSATQFKVRFINDLGNQNFDPMTATLVNAEGATVPTITTIINGDPNSASGYREQFRGRAVRDQNSATLPILNNPLFYNTAQPFTFINGERVSTGFNDSGTTFRDFLLGQNAQFPGTDLVELFRVPLKATDGDNLNPITFVGSVADLDIDNFFVTVSGFNNVIDAERVAFDPAPQLLITEPVSAVNDLGTVINEGPGATVLINVLANDIDNQGAITSTTNPPSGNLQIVSPLTPLDASQGTIAIENGQIRYTVPNGDFNGVVTFQYVIRDAVDTSVTDTGTVQVTVKATNDPPVNNVPGTQTMNEDQVGGLVFGGANAISISDVDAGSAIVRVTLTAPAGDLTLNPAATGALTTLSGNGTGDIEITGTINNINAALSGLRFNPDLNFNGPTTLTIVTNDQGNSAHPDNASIGTDTDVITINVTAVNDAPINTAPTPREVDEEQNLAFTGINALSVLDVDAGTGTIRVDLNTNSTAGGVLSATAVGGATVTGSGSQSLRIEGQLSAVNATLLTLFFEAGMPETLTLTMTTNDLGNTGGGDQIDQDVISITVLATVRPRATPETINVVEGPAFFDFFLLTNDLPNMGAQVTLEGAFSASVGTVQVIDAGIPGDKRDDIVRYTPPADFFGQVTFSYNISETPVTVDTVLGPNATALVTVNIANTPDVPVAQDDGPYSATEDIALNVNAASGVLANDTDADNLTAPFNAGLTAVLTAQPPVGQGTVSLNADGSFTWTPTLNFAGPSTTFRYQARDPQGNLSPEATVTINVAAVNDAPVAVDDGPGGLYSTLEDNDLSILVPGVLANDTDVDSPAGNLTVAISQAMPANQGTVTLQPDGSFLYEPALNFNGEATFRYRVSDNDPTNPQTSNEGIVRITVTPVNDAPVASPAEFFVTEGGQVIRDAASGLRTFVADPDQPSGFTGAINLNSGLSPNQGTLNLLADGSFTYTAPSDVVTGFDVTFTYTAFDGTVASNVATVTIHVGAANDAPVGLPDGPYAATEDTTLNVDVASGVLANDSDEETSQANLEAVLLTNVPASAGSVALALDGSFIYTPAAHFFGNTSFTYRVRDEGDLFSSPVTVTLQVAEVNDPPIANDDTADFLVKDIAHQEIKPDPLANDSKGVDANVPGEVLSISSVNPVSAQGGTVTLEGGKIFYTPAPGFFGFDSIEYTISDRAPSDSPLFDTATISFEVKNFIPKTVSGKVYIDADNDGVIDSGESPVAGVRIELTGTTVLGAFSTFTTTDASGNYSIENLAPGDYVLTQIQPLYLTPGKDSVNTSAATAGHVTNSADLQDNKFNLDWDAPDFTGNITGLNFGERGIDASSLVDATGLLAEILSSSGNPYGMILSADGLGGTDWSYTLNGWTTTALCQVEVAANGSIPSLLLTVNGVTKRIYQDPSNNHGGNTPPAGSLGRFRVLGRSAAGDYIIRLDGTLADFGFVAAAAIPAEAGEGEGPVNMADGEYRQAADEVFSEESWA